MRRTYFFCLIVILLSVCPVRAAVVVQDYLGNGQNVVLDTNTGYHWYSHLPDFGAMTYDQQVTAIGALGNYGNLDGGWRMASAPEVEALFINPADDLVASFSYTGSSDPFPMPFPPYDMIWHGRTTTPVVINPSLRRIGEMYAFSMVSPDGPYIGAYTNVPEVGVPDDFSDPITVVSAWIVTDASVIQEPSVIPAPGALMLGVTGLLSSTVVRKRLRGRR